MVYLFQQRRWFVLVLRDWLRRLSSTPEKTEDDEEETLLSIIRETTVDCEDEAGKCQSNLSAVCFSFKKSIVAVSFLHCFKKTGNETANNTINDITTPNDR